MIMELKTYNYEERIIVYLPVYLNLSVYIMPTSCRQGTTTSQAEPLNLSFTTSAK